MLPWGDGGRAGALPLAACRRITDRQKLTSQNAPGSTIGDLGRVFPPQKMPIFGFLRQAPRWLLAIAQFFDGYQVYTERISQDARLRTGECHTAEVRNHLAGHVVRGGIARFLKGAASWNVATACARDRALSLYVQSADRLTSPRS